MDIRTNNGYQSTYLTAHTVANSRPAASTAVAAIQGSWSECEKVAPGICDLTNQGGDLGVDLPIRYFVYYLIFMNHDL